MERAWAHPVLSCAEARAWEKRLLSSEAAEWDAMQRAGRAIATAIEADAQEIGGLPREARILVLVGKGHNGGDALLAARELLQARPAARAVVVLAFGADSLRPLAARSFEWLQRDAVGRVETLSSDQAFASGTRYALSLDGLFGFQFRSPMDSGTKALVAKVNAHPAIQLRAAVDLPSGVGEVSDDTAMRADFTYATGAVKQPVLASDRAAWRGRLRYLDLGFFGAAEPDGANERVLTPAILGPLSALRAAQTDKRTFGHLFVVGGSRSYPGAVVLAVRAALRSGVGLVTAFVPERLAPEYAARHPEAMWVGCPETTKGGLGTEAKRLIDERASRATALLMGPGLGAEAETLGLLQEVVRAANVPLVLDADALRPEVLAAAHGQSVICTPHAGEYQRLGGRTGLRPAQKDGTIVAVLKGPLTSIVSATGGQAATGPTYYSPFGGPVLARGGSGDILAGLIGGLLAQTPADPLLAAARGTVWHGTAADLLARQRGQVAVEISEILEQLGPALLS